MNKLIPIQSIYCSKEDETKLCSFDTEVLSAPTTPLIHPMSRLWLVNEGEGTLLLNNKEYTLKYGSCLRTALADYRYYFREVYTPVFCDGILF